MVADERELLPFDRDEVPLSRVNMEAARQRGWEYDVRKRAYFDIDSGEEVADRYGDSIKKD